jgi:putative sporulation protein YtaF
VYFGRWLTHWTSPTVARFTGAGLFCGLGIWMMLPALRRTPAETAPGARSSPSLLRLLQQPELADRDRSREIDLGEATLLALALSLNNIAGGVCAGLIRLDAVAIAVCSAAISCLVVEFGNRSGCRLVGSKSSDHVQLVAGLLLVAFGLLQLR